VEGRNDAHSGTYDRQQARQQSAGVLAVKEVDQVNLTGKTPARSSEFSVQIAQLVPVRGPASERLAQ
jgi:hypothetical protein